MEFGVVTVGAMQAGTVGNIIPDSAVLRGTIRSYKPEVRAKLLDGVRRTAKAAAMMAGAPEPEVTLEEGALAVVNIDNHTGHQAQTARLLWGRGALQLEREGNDLFLQRKQDGLAVPKQLFHPSRHLERDKVASLPPVLHRLQTVINHQTAPLGFELFARFDQLLALPMNGPRAFLFFAGHAHDRQRVAITLHKAIQPHAKRLGIQPVSLHPLVALIQLLRADHVAMNPQGSKLPLQRKTKSARFIDRVHFGSSVLLEPGRPVQERLLWKSLRRLGIGTIHLLHHHIKILMHINPKLDRASAAIKLAAGSLE